MTVRKAELSDAGRIAEIYSYYVTDTPISFEITPPDRTEMEKRMKEFAPYPFIVLEEDGCVTGYAYAHKFSHREAYRRSVEVTIYLDKNQKGKGGGKLLYNELEKELQAMGFVHNLYAIVVYPGYGSIEFHKAMGYEIMGILHDAGEKFGQLWSVAYMEKRI